MIGRLFLLLLIGASAFAGEPLHYPETRKDNVVDDYHGTKVADPYRWLEDTDSPETKAWVAAENKLTFGYLAGLPDRAGFRARLTSLLNFERFSPLRYKGGRYFFTRNTGLQNQSVLYTTKDLQAQPQPLLDPNTLAKDGTVALATTAASEDGKLLAYAVAASGSDWNEVRVREIESGHDRPDLLHWLKFSWISWTHDNQGFFYPRYPEPKGGDNSAQNRSQSVYYHHLGDPQEKDRLILETPDHPDWSFGAKVTNDGRYVVIIISHAADDNNLVYFKDLQDPQTPNLDGPTRILVDHFDANYDGLDVVGNRLFLLTDKDAPRGKVVATNVEEKGPGVLTDVIPEQRDSLESCTLAGGKLIASYLVDAKCELKVFDLDGKPAGDIPLPTLGTVPEICADPDRTELFYSFTSFLYPAAVYRYDLATHQNDVFRKPDFRAEDYEAKQLFYRSKDGTRVPMFVVHRKGLELDGNNPVFLTAYGGFNIALTPEFSATWLSWVEKGGVFAIPNLRGGGEYGRQWHLAGTRERKQNVFDDFFAAAESLIAEHYTSAKRIAIRGASNGGLLIGAALTQRPDLFGAAVPMVGVLDMLRYQKFTIGWAWEPDYGVSDQPEAFAYLSKYSPLQNVKPGTCYPPTLIATADHDDRVVPAHSFKFAAAMQAAQGCPNPVLIRIGTQAGHGRGKPLSKLIEEESDFLAFMWDHVASQKRVSE
jgi:prolyl oligopeptidase